MPSIILNKILNKIDLHLKGLQVRQCKEKLKKAGYDKLFADAENDAFPPEYFDLWTMDLAGQHTSLPKRSIVLVVIGKSLPLNWMKTGRK